MKVLCSLMVGLLVLGAASVATAQIAAGNIYGNVADEQGARLPGVTVTLSSKSIGSRDDSDRRGGPVPFLEYRQGHLCSYPQL